MITHKKFLGNVRYQRFPNTYKSDHFFAREGWFLFGFIPLYVRDLELRPCKK